MCGSHQGRLEKSSKPVRRAAGVQGPPDDGGEQAAVIDFVGATGGKSKGRARSQVQLIEDK